MPEAPPTRRRWFQFGVKGLLLAMLGLGALFAWFSYRMRNGAPVEFLVPVGFIGTIEVTSDTKTGAPLRFEGGQYIFVVPPSGKILIKDTANFHRWHKEVCHDVQGHVRNLQIKGASWDGSGTETLRWDVK